MHLHVHCSIICSSPDMEKLKCLYIDKWIKALWCVCVNETLFNHKRRMKSVCDRMFGCRQHYAMGNKSEKCHMICLICGILKTKLKRTTTTKKKIMDTRIRLVVTRDMLVGGRNDHKQQKLVKKFKNNKNQKHSAMHSPLMCHTK